MNRERHVVSKTEKNKRYHHGDLRNALIIAAATLIEERGSEDFAMIDAARRAGVSSAAPYRHFKDKTALLEAVLEFAFFTLGLEAEACAAKEEQGSVDAIIAIGKGYIRFVTGHPQFYSLMWGDSSLRQVAKPDHNASSSGFYVLEDTVRAWCLKIGRSDEDALALSIKLWAMAHGLSGIAMHGHIDRFLPGADVYALLESTTHTFLEGVKHSKPGSGLAL
ncbi:TetR/AcrR family transcriptional regulator [Kineobactrum sediminis]|uniref:TetR/AcrR family transcriptional regulator n=1 Tax=Kineobactrum sediminis TaxID=1905677 RepID=A0A2N5Y1I7_9GAMM|nr:TetR/AcrR family transcriptional regulator [Kineobactrum sediminis]PLW82229.1 TetR/AcrR family transcriptional regulator [Kineobactrum sediminis]